MASFVRALGAFVAVGVLASCAARSRISGGHSASATASADEDVDDDGPPPSTTSNVTASATAVGPAVSATLLTAPTVAPPANCPIACSMMAPAARSLAADDIATLGAALAPTVAGLHGCIGDTTAQYIRAPALLARFAQSGELLDLGVDSDGWSQAAQICFDGVVHGGTQPQVTMQGRATVRCSETCGARHGGRGFTEDGVVYGNARLGGAPAPTPTATATARPMRMPTYRSGGGGRGGGRSSGRSTSGY